MALAPDHAVVDPAPDGGCAVCVGALILGRWAIALAIGLETYADHMGILAGRWAGSCCCA